MSPESLQATITALATDMVVIRKKGAQDQTASLGLSYNRRIAIYFSISVSGRNFGYEKDGKTQHPEWEASHYAAAHLLISSEHDVFVAEEKGDHRGIPRMDKVGPEDFEYITGHDSAWRTDGLNFIRRMYFDVYKKCWSHVPDEHRVAPALSNTEASIVNIFKPTLSFYVIDVRRNPVLNHKYDLLSYEELDWSLSLQPAKAKTEKRSFAR